MKPWICVLAATLLLAGAGRADDDDKNESKKPKSKGSVVQIDLSKLPPEAANRIRAILKDAEKNSSKKPEAKKPEPKKPEPKKPEPKKPETKKPEPKKPEPKKPEPKKPEAKKPGKPEAKKPAAPGKPATEGIGKFVQGLHARGLRGPALARAIHAELERRGLKEKSESPGKKAPSQGKKSRS